MNLKPLLIAVLALTSVHTSAQHYGDTRQRLKARDTLIVKQYTDSLRALRQRIDTTTVGSTDAARAQTFYLFSPTTFYHSVVKSIFGEEGKANAVAPELMNIYLNRPELVAKSERRVNKAGAVHKEFSEPIRDKRSLVDKRAEELDIVRDELDDMPVEILVRKPNFWTVSGDYYLQLLQNYVSSNWYKGGESNISTVGSITLQANYNNKQKVKFDNKLELKLGLQTTRDDSLHSVKTSEDLIRYTGKLGLQATKRWYYSLQLIAYTQFMKGYKSNDSNVYSDIFSPLNINLSIGMDYTVEWLKKKLTGTVHIAPLAYNFKYVGRKALATRYGLTEGSHTLNDFGSECTVDLTWAFSDMIKWKTRLYAYTTYKRMELEWENTLTLQFNKYIAANMFLYPRFDDGATRDADHGYWQFKEYASIGFAYSF